MWRDTTNNNTLKAAEEGEEAAVAFVVVEEGTEVDSVEEEAFVVDVVEVDTIHTIKNIFKRNKKAEKAIILEGY